MKTGNNEGRVTLYEASFYMTEDGSSIGTAGIVLRIWYRLEGTHYLYPP